jgi:hypothetical protein
MGSVVRVNEVSLQSHPPYLDAGLKGELGPVFESDDGCFKAVYWIAEGPGKLLERPKADELICVLEGEALVDQGDERVRARPGDVILWLREDPPLITIEERLVAFAVVYDRIVRP